MRYSIAQIAINEIPLKVRNIINQSSFSPSNFWNCRSVAKFNKPLQPYTALLSASFQILLECTLLNLCQELSNICWQTSKDSTTVYAVVP